MSDYPGQAYDETHSDNLQLGRFQLRVVYRCANGGQGLTIHVFGPAHGSRHEVLRFDCFQAQPHYHLGWSSRDEPFIPIPSDKPFEWALDQLADRIQVLLLQSEAEAMSDGEISELPHVLAAIRAKGEALLRNA